MGYDPYSPITPAVINVLCLPAASIRAKNFDKYVSWLKTHASSVPFASSNEGEEPEVKVQSTSLFFNYATDIGPKVLRNSSFYEPNRQLQLALGLIDGSALPQTADASIQLLQQAYAHLQTFLNRNDNPTAIAHLIVIGVSIDFSNENFTYVQSIEDTEALATLNPSLRKLALSTLSHAAKIVDTVDAEIPRLVATSDRLNGAEARPDVRTLPLRSQTPTLSNGSPSTSVQNFGSTREEGGANVSVGRMVASGILLIQQGQWVNALGQLVAAAKTARDVNDPAWHAKALEGLLGCMLLLAWVGVNFNIPQGCYPNTRGFPSSTAVHAIADANRAMSDRAITGGASGLQGFNAMLPGLVATIMILYEKASSGYEDGLPHLITCEARIRLARLLVIVQKHGGSFTMDAMSEIVGHPPLSAYANASKTGLVRLILQPSLLGSLLIESVTEAQARLSMQLAISIHLAVCNSLSTLQLDRKLGFYLKEVLQKLPPALVEARKVGAAEVALHPSSAGLIGVSSNGKEHAKISQGVRSLLEQIVRVYGLPEASIDQDMPQKSMSAKFAAWHSALRSGDISTKLEILRLCIRVSDALPDWVGSVEFMSLLLFVSRQNMTISIGSPNPSPMIPTEEQTRLLNGIQHTSDAARKLNLSVLASYWDDFLVRRVALHENPSAGKLMPHSSRDLSLATVSGTEKRDPFIYNPFSGNVSASGPTILVKGETATFDVLLQNPLEVDVEIQRISLNTCGCAFEAQSHNMVLGPLCVQNFTMKGVASEVGNLHITGCNAQVRYCHARDFEIYTNQWQLLGNTQQKAKKLSQTDRAQQLDLPVASSLEIQVVGTLPQVNICSSNLTQNSVMLLEGETCRFAITVENSSELPADLVLFGYQDSVTRQLQEALSTKDLQPVDMFELQHQLTGKPAIRRISSKNGHNSAATASNVDAHSTRTFEFEILGKSGLTDVSVLIDYAHLGKPRSEVEGTFYTRQLRFQVSVTVNAGVDIPRCNILSIPAIAQGMKSPDEKPGKRHVTADGVNEVQNPQHDQCLLQLDLRSIWPHPVTVRIESSSTISNIPHESKWRTVASLTLQPGIIDRALVLLPKVFIEDPFAPVPSLDTKRQFVVSASMLSLEAEMATREAFWYREKLCQSLRISWNEEHGSRKGVLDVRKGIRLSARMIDALKIDHVQISFMVLPIDDGNAEETVQQSTASEFIIKRNDFARLVVRVQNFTSENLKLLLRLQPSLHQQPHKIAMDLSKKFLWSGALQQVLRGLLGPNETKEAELGIVALVVGSYEINATVEEVRSRTRQAESSLPSTAATVERRIWHARRPCLIHAVDKLPTR